MEIEMQSEQLKVTLVPVVVEAAVLDVYLILQLVLEQ